MMWCLLIFIVEYIMDITPKKVHTHIYNVIWTLALKDFLLWPPDHDADPSIFYSYVGLVCFYKLNRIIFAVYNLQHLFICLCKLESILLLVYLVYLIDI